MSGQDGVFAGGFVFSQEFFGRVLIGRDGIVKAGNGGGEPAEAVLEETEFIEAATVALDGGPFVPDEAAAAAEGLVKGRVFFPEPTDIAGNAGGFKFVHFFPSYGASYPLYTHGGGTYQLRHGHKSFSCLCFHISRSNCTCR